MGNDALHSRGKQQERIGTCSEAADRGQRNTTKTRSQTQSEFHQSLIEKKYL